MGIRHRLSWSAPGLAGTTDVTYPFEITDPAIIDREQIRQALAAQSGRTIADPFIILDVHPTGRV